MHVVVVGCGRVGSGLAVQLAGQGHDVSIVDKAARAFRRLPADWPGNAIVGSGFDRDDLDKAGAREAGALAAVTSGDNSNILTARIARENYGIPNVVARIYDPRRAEIYQRLGIPTVATVTWTIDRVMRRLLPDDLSGEWTDSTGGLVLVERPLPDTWAGKRLRELAMPGQAILAAVTRAGLPRLDATELVGQEGDVLTMMVAKDAVDELERRLCGAPAADANAANDNQGGGDAGNGGGDHRSRGSGPGAKDARP
jgi:trk system potassium uptake protein